MPGYRSIAEIVYFLWGITARREYRPASSTSPILFSTGFSCFNVWPEADDKNAAFLEHLLMVPAFVLNDSGLL